jgi:hypothetical protein
LHLFCRRVTGLSHTGKQDLGTALLSPSTRQLAAERSVGSLAQPNSSAGRHWALGRPSFQRLLPSYSYPILGHRVDIVIVARSLSLPFTVQPFLKVSSSRANNFATDRISQRPICDHQPQLLIIPYSNLNPSPVLA